MIRKILKWSGAVLLLAAIGIWYFWPQGLVVKGPMLDFLLGRQVEAPTAELMRRRFELPAGFRIGIFASGINNARSLIVTATGDVMVTSMRPGQIVLLHRDADGDGAADGRTLLADGLDWPHSIALWNGWLYIAETERIIRARFDAGARTLGPREVVFDGMPPGGNHRTRSIGFDAAGHLFVTIGSSCNVCIEEQPYRASMLRMDADGSNAVTHATGLRNSVGFDWQPGTGALYATDNGRDLLGDDTPHCELNRIEEGADYGWPYAYEDRKPDPDFGPGNEERVAASRPMAHGLGAHVAPLGIRFFDPGTAPPGYENAALVALHGSWNRSVLSGYKLVSLHFSADGSIEQRDFLTGFEEQDDVIGRPVEMAYGAGGAIYVSDDYAGVVYKIGWGDIAVPGFTLEDTQVTDSIAELGEAAAEEQARLGAEVYAENGCAACHDPAAATQGVQVKELAGLKERFDINGLKALFKAPPGPMPAFELSDADAGALAVYLLTTFGENQN